MAPSTLDATPINGARFHLCAWRCIQSDLPVLICFASGVASSVDGAQDSQTWAWDGKWSGQKCFSRVVSDGFCWGGGVTVNFWWPEQTWGWAKIFWEGSFIFRQFPFCPGVILSEMAFFDVDTTKKQEGDTGHRVWISMHFPHFAFIYKCQMLLTRCIENYTQLTFLCSKEQFLQCNGTPLCLIVWHLRLF